MTNVAPLFGQPLPQEIDAEVVSKLKELLAMAESGEITGIAYVTTKTGNRISQGWVSNLGDGHRLSTGIMQLVLHYSQSW